MIKHPNSMKVSTVRRIFKGMRNPLVLDKHGLFKDYMKSLNRIDETVVYERPNKYNFNLVSK